MDYETDYEFKWWDDSCNGYYITSDKKRVEHSNKLLGEIDSPQASLEHYIYGDPDIIDMDNVFYAMDVRRANLKQFMSKVDKPSYTTKQRAYIEWYYITRGIPIAAQPSEEVQEEFDRYYLLSSGHEWSYLTKVVKHIPRVYKDIIDSIRYDAREGASALEIADFYQSWFTYKGIPHNRSIRSLYCYSWDDLTHTCIRKQIENHKSLKLTEYIRQCMKYHILSIDYIIQPTLDMLVLFELDLKKDTKIKEYTEYYSDKDYEITLCKVNTDKKDSYCKSFVYTTQEKYGLLRFNSVLCYHGLVVTDPGLIDKVTINTSPDNVSDIKDKSPDNILDTLSSTIYEYLKRVEYNDIDNRDCLASLIGRLFNIVQLVVLPTHDNDIISKALDMLSDALKTFNKLGCYDLNQSRDPVKYYFISYVKQAIKLIEDQQQSDD